MKQNNGLKLVIAAMVMVQVFQIWFLWHRGYFKNSDPAQTALYIGALAVASLAVLCAVYYKTKVPRLRNRGRQGAAKPIRGPEGVDDLI